MRKTASAAGWISWVFPLLGLACIWPFLFGPFTFHDTTVSWLLPEGSRRLVDSLAVVAAAILVAVIGKKHARVFSRVSCAIVCAAMGLASTLILSLGAIASAQVAGSAMRAAYVVLGSVLWGCCLSHRTARQALILVAFSGAVSFAVQGVLAINDTFMLAALIIGPPASMLMLYLSGFAARQVPKKVALDVGRPFWAMCLGCIAFIWFEMAFSRVLFYRGNIQTDAVFGLSAVIICAVCAGMALYLYVRKNSTPRQMIPLFCALIIVYMAALLIAILFPQQGLPIPARIMVASGSCFRVLLWMVLIQAACMRKVPVVPACAVFDVVVLGLPIGSLVESLLQSAATVQADGLFVPYSTTSTIATVALFVIACAAVALAMIGPKSGADAPRPDAEDACRSIAESAGLSHREYDVMLLICRGYSAKRAAEALCLSESTINTHTDHIYKKLGVHSKQEMISLVERECGRPFATL